MASSLLSVFGRGNDSGLPASLTRSGANLDTAFEVFIEGALTKIYNEAGGRSKEQRAVRESCKQVLGEYVSLQWGYELPLSFVNITRQP